MITNTRVRKMLAFSLMKTFFYKMDELSPEGHYFGSHPGDGSDFGYWEVDEDMM